MKKIALCLTLALLCAPFTTVSAAPAPPPGDIIIPVEPLPLDPCQFADAKATMTYLDNVSLGYVPPDHSVTEVFYGLDFTALGATGYMTMKYSRYTSGSDDMVALDITITVEGVAIFGKAFNNVQGVKGAKGVILSVIDSTGQTHDIKGTFRIGEGEICFFLQD